MIVRLILFVLQELQTMQNNDASQQYFLLHMLCNFISHFDFLTTYFSSLPFMSTSNSITYMAIYLEFIYLFICLVNTMKDVHRESSQIRHLIRNHLHKYNCCWVLNYNCVTSFEYIDCTCARPLKYHFTLVSFLFEGYS